MIMSGSGSVITGLGPVTSVTAGMNTGIAIGGGPPNPNLTGSLVPNQLGPSAVPSLQQQQQQQQPGVGGPIPVTQPQSNPLGVIAGAPAGVNAVVGVNPGVNPIAPASGLAPQPVQQTVSSASTITPAGTPPQQPPGALKYTKLWEVE